MLCWILRTLCCTGTLVKREKKKARQNSETQPFSRLRWWSLAPLLRKPPGGFTLMGDVHSLKCLGIMFTLQYTGNFKRKWAVMLCESESLVKVKGNINRTAGAVYYHDIKWRGIFKGVHKTEFKGHRYEYINLRLHHDWLLSTNRAHKYGINAWMLECVDRKGNKLPGNRISTCLTYVDLRVNARQCYV